MNVAVYKNALAAFLDDALPGGFDLLIMDDGRWRCRIPSGDYCGDFQTPTETIQRMIADFWIKL